MSKILLFSVAAVAVALAVAADVSQIVPEDAHVPHKDASLVETKDPDGGILGPLDELHNEKEHPDPAPEREGGGGYNPDPGSSDYKQESTTPDGHFKLGGSRRRIGAGFHHSAPDWEEPHIEGWKAYKGHRILNGAKLHAIRDNKLRDQTKVGSIISHPGKLKSQEADGSTVDVPTTSQGEIDKVEYDEHKQMEAIRHNETDALAKSTNNPRLQGGDLVQEQASAKVSFDNSPEEKVYKTIQDRITKAILSARAEEEAEQEAALLQRLD